MVNGNIRLEKGKLKLPKLTAIKIKQHREIPDEYKLKSVTVSREQRKLSKCVKGSRNYQKQKKKVALCHDKVRNQRKDYHHKLSRQIAETYDVVAVEDLNMKVLSQCLYLGKGVMDKGYGMFLNLLDYKMKERKMQVIKVVDFIHQARHVADVEE